jgi:hypothetical protein
MQPIKTTNAMNPAPAKGIQSLPTPVIDDVIITEVVNAWKGDYQKLEYGTMWDSVPHGSQQGSFPEHKLVFQQTSSEDGQWVKRIWVNDRVNQDSYNYAIKYSAGSQAHPIYTRTYVVPREGYEPLPDGTPDTLFPTAVLVDEEADRTGNELDSKYITVIRVYETLPGPILAGKQMVTQFGGGVVDITQQTVFTGTGATGAEISPNFRTIQSSITPEDVSKSTIKTAELPSGEEWPVLTTYKDGPFNERIIIESQVVPIGTPLPNNSGAIIWESEDADKWRSIHTSRNCSALLDKQFIEYQTTSFTFPALLKIRGRTLSDRSNITYQRPSQSGIFITKTITEYTEDLPDFFEDPYIISTVSFSSDAGTFSGVLHNCYNYVSDEQTIRAPQSFPSSINYAIGDEVLIRQSTDKEQIGLYKTVKTYIELI